MFMLLQSSYRMRLLLPIFMDTIGKGARTGMSKAYESVKPIRLFSFIELITQNGCYIDFIDNIYHTFFACMFRMPSYDYTV